MLIAALSAPFDEASVRHRRLNGGLDAFILERILSEKECSTLRDEAEQMGYSFWNPGARNLPSSHPALIAHITLPSEANASGAPRPFIRFFYFPLQGASTGRSATRTQSRSHASPSPTGSGGGYSRT